ncbi:response regulator transcription factor [Actinopolymorpha sp. B11F2]|uniref:response regulator n=1 Tax=Actinopolymorpha sp. B11F2 TaxID=3160862 RepID=UPI0032E40689
MRCLLVDDSARFVRAAKDFLEREGIAVVGVAATHAEAVRQAEESWPDVALVDINLGGESGFELARALAETARLSRKYAPPKIILISSHPEKDFEELVEDSPALGFLDKSVLSGNAIRRILGDAVDET